MKILWSALALNLVVLPVEAQPRPGAELERSPVFISGNQQQSFNHNVLPLPRSAQARSSSEQFNISKMTVDNGGKHATSSQYVISGSVGQPDASSTRASNGYRLSGGFWFISNGVVIPVEAIFADSFEDQE